MSQTQMWPGLIKVAVCTKVLCYSKDYLQVQKEMQAILIKHLANTIKFYL